jgi:hypothetical protein
MIISVGFIFNFVSTSATVQTITHAGLTTVRSVTFNGLGGSWQFTDTYNQTVGIIILTAGTLNTNGQSVTCSNFTLSSSSARTLTLGASAVTVNGTGVAWSGATTTGLTVTANTATVTMTGASPTFTAGGFNWNGMSLSFTGSGTPVLNCGTGATFQNLSRIGTATKSDALSIIGTPITVSGTFTATGNSLTNRLHVLSATVGTTKTITAAAVSLTNVDFQDITAAGAAISWTGTSLGDCLGNTNIIFTTPVTRYWVGGGGSWDSTTKWSASSGGASGASVPLPQDDVFLDANSGLSSGQTVTTNAMPRLGKNIDWTGVSSGAILGVPTNIASIFGNWTFAAGVNTGIAQNGLMFMGRSSHTITSAGVTYSNAITFNGLTGTYTMQDAITTTSTMVVSANLVTQGFTITCTTFTGAGAVTITPTTSIFNLTATASSNILIMTSSAVFATPPGEVNIVNASTATRTIAMSGRAIKTLNYTVANSPGSLTFLAGASATITNFNVNAGKIITLPATAVQTITNTFNVNGAANGYVYMPGVVGNYASSPDIAAYAPSAGTTLDWISYANPNVWNDGSGTEQYIMSQNDNTTNISWRVGLINNGSMVIYTSTNGSIQVPLTKTHGLTTGDGGRWVRWSLDQSTGIVTFYLSNDSPSTDPASVTWNSLGTSSYGGARNLFDSSVVLAVGSSNSVGTSGPFAGRLYRTRYVNGGTIVFDADFSGKPVGANTFTESSPNAATVTINGALAQVGDGRVSLVSSTPGSQATLSKATGVVSSDYLSIQDSNATGGAKWYAGSNSIDVSNNTGWIFAASNPDNPNANRFFGVFE